MNKRFVLRICILVFVIFLGIGIPKKVEGGYRCPADTYCETAGGTYGPGVWVNVYDYELCSYIDRRVHFNCSGDSNNCNGQSPFFYYYESDCLKKVNSGQLFCCNLGSPPPPPCTPATSCSCSPLSGTETSYGSKTVECDNGCGGTASSTCWCTSSCLKQCPIPLLNTGVPKLILNDFRECTNDCSVKPPEDQDDCYETESPQPEEFLTIVKDQQEYANHYGFSSITHTGDRLVETAKLGTLNDPFNLPITMKATYEDDDGASDIEGLFVWFRGEQYTGELGTPIFLSATADPKASANDSWGFMLRRVGSVWQPYVPSYNEGNVFWTSKDTSGNVFSIDGENGDKMVEVTILKKPETPMLDPNKVIMEFSLRFSDNNGELFSDNVSEGLYRIYLMGLDKFSFTPYDNYDMDINYQEFWSEGFKYNGEENLSPFWQPSQLRYKPEQGQLYARDWSYKGQTWTIDRTAPTLNTEITVSGNSIILSWNVKDDKNLYAIVGNIFTSGDDVKTITVSTETDDVSLHHPATFSLNSDDNGVDENKIGILNRMDVSLFQVDPNINGTEHSGSVTLNINHDAQNSLYFYLTVFDDAGNIVQSEESGGIEQDLDDWMSTSGGLSYSQLGATFTVKDLVDVIWENILPPSGYGNNLGLLPASVDYTSELWAESSDSPVTLSSHMPLGSYSLGNFLGLNIDKYYALFADAYEKNKKNLGDSVKEIDISEDYPNLSDAVTNYCSDKEYCVFKYDNNSNAEVVIEQDFACNKKTLMFINGDLTINPPLKNSTDTDKLSNKNGCIFVVSGNVNILEGGDASDNNASFKYDKVNGYILADGQIIIEDEYIKRNNIDPIIDGVYINGGLQSLGDNKSILFNRYLRLEDRLKFPLLTIDLHPKYGVLGEKFFGKKYLIQIIESGVKP